MDNRELIQRSLDYIVENLRAEITAADGEVKLVMQGNSAVVLELA